MRLRLPDRKSTRPDTPTSEHSDGAETAGELATSSGGGSAESASAESAPTAASLSDAAAGKDSPVATTPEGGDAAEGPADEPPVVGEPPVPGEGADSTTERAAPELEVPVTPRDRWPTLIAGLLAGVLALAAAAAVLGVLLSGTRGTDASREAATGTAERISSELLTLGYENSPDAIGRMLDMSTGALRTQLTALSSTLTSLLQQGQVVSGGRVTSSAIERIDGATAEVLVAAEAVVKNTELPDGQQRAYRIAVTLQRHDDRWLASAVDFVG